MAYFIQITFKSQKWWHDQTKPLQQEYITVAIFRLFVFNTWCHEWYSNQSQRLYETEIPALELQSKKYSVLVCQTMITWKPLCFFRVVQVALPQLPRSECWNNRAAVHVFGCTKYILQVKITIPKHENTDTLICFSFQITPLLTVICLLLQTKMCDKLCTHMSTGTCPTCEYIFPVYQSVCEIRGWKSAQACWNQVGPVKILIGHVKFC